MEEEIEKNYLNNPKINPKRLSFKCFYKQIIIKPRQQHLMHEIRFLYVVKMLMKHREIKTPEPLIIHQKKIIQPLPKIKFELKMLEDL